MTTELIELSKRVADKYGIDSKTYHVGSYMSAPLDDEAIVPLDYTELWLYQDWNKLIPLAIEHDVPFRLYSAWATSFYWISDIEAFESIEEAYSNHESKENALAAAILRALLDR